MRKYVFKMPLIKPFILFSAMFAATANAQDGTIDSTFGVNGIVRYYIGATGGQGLAVLPDGRFYRYGDYAWTKLNAMRSKADGSIDSSFGVNGIATIDYTNLLSRVQLKSLDIQPDGKLVIAGIARNFFTPPIVNEKNLLVRFDTNGVSDINRQFGFREICYPTSVKCTADGKILVTGSSYYSIDWQPPEPQGNYAYVAKFDENGNEDNSFGNSGLFEMFGNSSCLSCVANRVALQPSGNIITYLDRGRFISLSPVGNMDFYFGNNGFASASTYDLVTQPDGKIIAGSFFSSLTRYTADGLVDSTFGVNGIANLGLTAYAPCLSLALQPDGKILAAGSLYSSGTQFKPMCCRLNSNGTLDSTFGINGMFVYTGFQVNGQFYKVVPYADKILLGATTSYDTSNYIRLNNTGFILPVHILTLTARLLTPSPLEERSDAAMLNWTVEAEQNFDRYQIERSKNGKDFTPIGSVNATGSKAYSYVDAIGGSLSVVGRLYYRLKMIDREGKFQYSPIRQLYIQHSRFTITPNPAHDRITLTGKKMHSVNIIDMGGRTVRQHTLSNSDFATIDIRGLAKGVYTVKVMSGDKAEVQKVVVE